MKDHFKSRHGCLRCKKRKVKCDETLPSCRRCLQRREACSYLNDYGGGDATQATQSKAASPTQRTHDGSPSLTVHQSEYSHTSCLEDMGLVHQFLTSTYETLWTHPKGQLIWRDFIFHAALKDTTLLNGILATAALHKIIIANSPSPELEEVALRRQTAALEGFRTMLPSVREEQYIVAYPMSLMVSYWAFASKNLPRNLDILTPEQESPAETSPASTHTANSALEEFSRLCLMIKPTRLVFAQFRSPLTQGVFAAMAAVPPIHELPKLTSSENHALAELDHHLRQTASLSSGAFENETFTMPYLYRVAKESQWLHLLVAWPIQLPEDFIDRIRDRDHATLTVLGYWAACMDSLNHQWWAKGWSKPLLLEIRSIVHDKWLELMTWPCERVGL